jgi:hypothetical protein
MGDLTPNVDPECPVVLAKTSAYDPAREAGSQLSSA